MREEKKERSKGVSKTLGREVKKGSKGEVERRGHEKRIKEKGGDE